MSAPGPGLLLELLFGVDFFDGRADGETPHRHRVFFEAIGNYVLIGGNVSGQAGLMHFFSLRC